MQARLAKVHLPAVLTLLPQPVQLPLCLIRAKLTVFIGIGFSFSKINTLNENQESPLSQLALISMVAARAGFDSLPGRGYFISLRRRVLFKTYFFLTP